MTLEHLLGPSFNFRMSVGAQRVRREIGSRLRSVPARSTGPMGTKGERGKVCSTHLPPVLPTSSHCGHTAGLLSIGFLVSYAHSWKPGVPSLAHARGEPVLLRAWDLSSPFGAMNQSLANPSLQALLPTWYFSWPTIIHWT